MLGDTWRRVVVEVSEDSNGTNITIPVDRGMVGTRRDTGRNSGHCKERCSKRSFSNNTSQQDEEIVVVQVASSALRVPSRFHYRHRSLASDNMTSSLSHNECIGMEYEHQLKQKSLKMHQMIRRAAGRIVLYPLVPILTQTLTIASEIDTYINGRVRFGLYLASYAAASCPGLLNALAFIVFDPAVHNILRVVREDLLTQYRARRDSGHLGWSGQVALWALHGGQAGEVAEERARRRSARLSTDFMPFGLYRDELEAAAERSRQVTGTAITSRTSTASALSSNPDVVVHTRRASAISGETAQVYRSLAHRRYRSYSGSSATNDSSSFSLQQAHRQKIGFGVPVAIVNGSGHRKQTSSVSAQSRDQLIKGPVMRKSSGSSLGNTSAQSKPEQIISEPSATPEEASNNETDTSWITTTYGSSSGQLPTSRFSWQPPSLNDANNQCAEADAEVEASELNDKVPAMVSFSSIYTRSRRGSRISLPMTSSAWREVELAYSDIFAPLSASSVPVHEILRLAHLHVRRSASDGNISANIPSRNSSFQMDGIAPIYNVSQQTATTASSFNSSMLHDQSLSNAYAQMATAAAAATVSTPQPAHCQSTDSVIININNEPAVLPGHHLFSDISTVDESQSSQSQYSTKDIDWPTSSLHIAPPNYNSICVPIDTTTNNKSGSTLEFLYLDEEHYLALNDDVQPVLSEETCEMLRLM
ncbi:hypothetical protein BDF19DRAFT_151424 [Syncephalis fuscata]|nr:hypothetical protein BDF19DRAFT_151424 [Syncephalis fuscata]